MNAVHPSVKILRPTTIPSKTPVTEKVIFADRRADALGLLCFGLTSVSSNPFHGDSEGRNPSYPATLIRIAFK